MIDRYSTFHRRIKYLKQNHISFLQILKEPKILLRWLSVILQLNCVLFAAYYTLLFSSQYSENGDEQLIEMKTFNKETENKYPTFSFCFKGARFHWFQGLQIFNEFGIDATQYELMLEGKWF